MRASSTVWAVVVVFMAVRTRPARARRSLDPAAAPARSPGPAAAPARSPGSLGAFSGLGPLGPLRPLTVAIRRRLDRRRQHGRLDASLAEAAAVADLLRVGCSGGLAVAAAIAEAHRRLPGADAGLGVVVRDIGGGARLDDALATWARDGPEPVAPLAAILRSAGRGGTAIVADLERFAADTRRRRRRRAEERARRLPVLLIVPLVTCILPAFGLTTVVPMVAVGLQRIAVPERPP